MTLRLQPGRVLLVLLCVLLGVFLTVETAHGHARPGEHCDLCLLTHAAALLPALPPLAVALRVLLAVEPARMLARARVSVSRYRIRPPPAAA